MENQSYYPATPQAPDLMRDFFDGVTSYGKALQLIRRHRLWYYVYVPGIISLILGSSLLYSGYLLSDDFAFMLYEAYPENWIGHNLMENITKVFSWIILAASGFLLYRVLLIAFVAPFMSPLAAKIQEIQTGRAVYDPPFFSFTNFRLILRGAFLSLRNVTKELWFTFWLLLLGFIPIFNLAAPFLILMVQSFYAGFSNMDYTLEKYYGISGSKKFASQYRGLTLGNGVTFIGLLSIPVLGLFFAPALSTAAGAIATVNRVDAPVKTVKQLESDFI
jgi:CysZ protein